MIDSASPPFVLLLLFGILLLPEIEYKFVHLFSNSFGYLLCASNMTGTPVNKAESISVLIEFTFQARKGQTMSKINKSHGMSDGDECPEEK
jgi:hypothetical protein